MNNTTNTTKPVETIKEGTPVSPAKPAEIKSEIYVQYRNREALTDEIVERVKAHYAAKNHSEPIEKIQIYLNIVESTAYYVINDRVFDKINIFA